MGLVTYNKGRGEAYDLCELVKTYTIINYLPQFGPIEGSMTTILNILFSRNPKDSFHSHMMHPT
jgi:hypothetical protein